MRDLVIVGLTFSLLACPVVAWAEDGGPSTPAEQLAQAEQLRSQLKWGEALEMFRVVAQRHAEDAAAATAAHLAMGRLALLMGRYAEAEQAMAALFQLSVDPEIEFNAKLVLVDSLRLQGRLDMAEDVVQGLTAFASSAEKRARLDTKWADILLDRGLLLHAVQFAEGVIASQASLPGEVVNEARATLMATLVDSWSIDQAEQVVQSIGADHNQGRASDAQFAKALLSWGKRYYYSLEFDAAKDPIRQALSLISNSRPDIAFDCHILLAKDYLAKSQDRRKQNWPEKNRDRRRRAAIRHYLDALHIAQKASFDDSRTDHARLKLAALWRDRKMTLESMCLARLGIDDPAQLTEADIRLSRHIGQAAPEDIALAWQQYLLSPTERVDPFQEMIRERFPDWTATASTGAGLNCLSERYYQIGLVQRRRREFDEALESFQAAVDLAQWPVEAAQALTSVAQVMSRRFMTPEVKQIADQAAREWLGALAQAKNYEQVRTAIHMAMASYNTTYQGDKAIPLLEEIVDQYAAGPFPKIAGYARYLLYSMYVGKRDEHLAETCRRQSFADFLEAPFGEEHEGHHWLCTRIMFHVARSAIDRGEYQEASSQLDEIQGRWPGRYDLQVTQMRSLIAEQ